MNGTACKSVLLDERFFGEAVDSLPGLFYLIDREGRFLYWNRNLELVSGYSSEELSRLRPMDLFDGPDRGVIADRISHVFLTGEATVEADLVSKDRGRTPYFFTGKRIQTCRGLCLVGMGVSLAGQKQAEELLRQRESREGAILEASLNCIVVIDHLGTIVEFNRAAERTFGIARSQALGKPMAEVIIPPRLRDAHSRGFAHYLATGEGRFLGRRIETRAQRADGSEFPVELAITPIKHGATWLFAGSLRDITERKSFEAKIERLNRVHAVLSGINALIIRVQDRDQLFDGACRVAVDAGKFRMAWVGVVDRDARKIVPAAAAGAQPQDMAFLREKFSLAGDAPMGNSLTARAVRDKTAFFCNDTQNDPRILFRKEHLESGTRSIAILPLLVSNEVVGVLLLYSGEADFFDAQEVRLLNELAGDISFGLDHIEKSNRLDYLAFYDSLTGLANRSLFLERLSQFVDAARRRRGKLALVLADIERFKSINDSLGRQAGDSLLKQVAERLVQAAGPDTVARVGADHFAVVLPETKGRSESGRFVERIWHACFTAPFLLGNTELRISAKAGITLFPNDGGNPEMLLADAEAALQKAKETGESFQFHTRELTAGVAEELALENELRQALEREQFVLYYQPKLDAESRRIVGAEALIRWQSPERGLVPPLKFIPLLEETGLILAVGTWALKRAALDHRRWADLGWAAVRVAVNVSPIQLRRRDFVGIMQQALSGGATPTGIDLEITESLIMEDVQAIIEKLDSARQFGVGVAIDDFGTGYSSLGYLAKLPVQSLKIDRSFIGAMLPDSGALTLVQTIISLAHSLKLKVIAEGVESEDQATLLCRMRCDQMQGYLFGKPVPFEQMTALLASPAARR